jgi:hypothetical protein
MSPSNININPIDPSPKAIGTLKNKIKNNEKIIRAVVII